MGDLVGILLVQAVERQTGESGCLRLVEIGSGHESSAKEDAYQRCVDHGSILVRRSHGMPPASPRASRSRDRPAEELREWLRRMG